MDRQSTKTVGIPWPHIGPVTVDGLFPVESRIEPMSMSNIISSTSACRRSSIQANATKSLLESLVEYKHQNKSRTILMIRSNWTYFTSDTCSRPRSLMYVLHAYRLPPRFYSSLFVEVCWASAAGRAGSANDTNASRRALGRTSGAQDLGNATHINASWETPTYNTHR